MVNRTKRKEAYYLMQHSMYRWLQLFEQVYLSNTSVQCTDVHMLVSACLPAGYMKRVGEGALEIPCG